MASITAATIVIPVTTNADKAVKKVNRLEKGLQKLGFSAKGASTAFNFLKGALPIVGVSLLITGFKKLIEVTERQQAAEAQLNAVLKSTQGAAGLTSKELLNMASSFQKVTTFSDEAIIEAQALLLTFTKVGKDVFPQATETILNMAQAMKTDLKTATIQVGKALNDPIQGVGALRRVGVQLSAQQEQLVKQFVATGQVAKAQAVILGELETQFGGVARAATKTLGGALKQLKNTFGDVVEVLGFGVSDVLIGAFNALNSVLESSKGIIAVVGAVFSGLFEVISEIASITVNFLKTAIGPLFDELKGGISPLTVIRKGFELLKIAIQGIEPILQVIATVIGAVFRVIGKVIKFFLKQIELFFKGIAIIAQKLAELGIISQNTANVFKSVEKEVTKATAGVTGFSKATTSATGALKNYRQEALEVLAGAGDISAQLDLLNVKFAEQAKIVSRAGMSTASLERFYQQQRLSQLNTYFAEAANIQGGSYEDRQDALNNAYSALLDSDNLSYEERLAAQAAYIEQSKALEQDRLNAINQNAQLIGGIAQQTITLGQKVTEFQNAQIESQIQKLKERGASEEEIEKKRRKLARKQAKDQKKFAIFSAIVNTALAVTNALASLPPPASFIVAALTAAIGIAEVAVIAAQPLPAQFGGQFQVPPGNEADSGLLRVNQGEQVSVTPTRFSGVDQQNGSKTYILSIDGQQFDAFLVDRMNKNLNNGKVQSRRKGVFKAG